MSSLLTKAATSCRFPFLLTLSYLDTNHKLNNQMPDQQQQKWWQWRNQTLVLRLKLQPRSSQEKLGAPWNGLLKVYINAPPVDGAANDRLVRLIAKHCGVPKSNIRITNGVKSKEKTVEVEAPRKLPPPLDVCAA
ncbi:DUF167 domain-containing protein [Halorhodospira halochloris]|uniref:DUF167 domain-containing protein n=1 Tax=Halorhodospira halochloris TaxID=1052 RepID=UPI001EE7BD38|nr:DUF167 domain-containing protein [Halorhodospira halochloris]MCG5547548.1 DUF167 domain-containing protein [Halorhodospira halochloris]